MAALMFATVIAAILSLAALAAIQVTQSAGASADSARALVAVGDRVQVALDEIHHASATPPRDRLDTTEQCAGGVCTTLSVDGSTDTSVTITVTALLPDGARGARTVTLVELPTSGVLAGVGADGRWQFVEDGGSGTDLWRIEEST